MAFNYRSPVQNVLSQFSSEEQSRISTTAVKSVAETEMKQHDLFSYHMSDYASMKLNKKGIYLSPYSFKNHSHPVCKTIENHLIYNVVPNYIDNIFFVVSVKGGKLSVLRHRSKMPTLRYINRYISAKDISRYGIDSYFNRASKKIFDQSTSINSRTLSDLVPEVLRVKARKLFLYDELHYWSPADLDNFLMATKPQIVVATHIYPKEILLGLNKSVNEWAYKFEIHKGKLIFSPDGCMEESYEQPLEGGFPLHLKSFTCSDGTKYTISVLYSLYSHSLIQISAGDLISEDTRFFSGFDASIASDLMNFGGVIKPIIPVVPETIRKICLYISSLKKPDLQSALAKLRTNEEDPSGYAQIFIREFTNFLMNNNICGNLIDYSIGDWIMDGVISFLPNALQRVFSRFKDLKLTQFLENVQEPVCRVQTCDGDRFCNSKFPSMSYLFREIGLLDSFSEICKDPISINLGKDRESCIYSSRGNFSIKTFIPNPPKKIGANLYYLLRKRFSPFSIRESAYIYLAFKRKGVFSFLNDRKIDQLLAQIGIEQGMSELINLCCIEINEKRRAPLSITNFNDEEEELVRTELEKNVRSKFAKVMHELKDFGFPLFKRIFKLRDEEFVEVEKGESVVRGEDNPIRTEVPDFEGIDDIMASFFATGNNVKEGGEEIKKNTEVIEAEAEPEQLIEKSYQEPEGGQIDSDEFIRICRCPCDLIIGVVKEPKLKEFKSKELFEFFPDTLRGRVAAFYSRDSRGYSYFGGNHKSLGWNDVLNDIIRTAKIDPNAFNQCLIQKYEIGASIGFHSDNEKIYPKGNLILTVNLYGLANFRIKCLEDNSISAFDLEDNEYFLMGAGMQETHLHSVTSRTIRVSLTFRSTNPNVDFFSVKEIVRNELIDPGYHEIKFGVKRYQSEKFGVKDISRFNIFDVPGDGDCFFHCLATSIGSNGSKLRKILMDRNLVEFNDKAVAEQVRPNVFVEDEAISAASKCFLCDLTIFDMDSGIVFELENIDFPPQTKIFLQYKKNHFSLLVNREGCFLRAVSEAIDMSQSEVLAILSRDKHRYLLDELMTGEGLPISLLESGFRIFGIEAKIVTEGETVILNPEGKISRFFSFDGSHIEFIKRDAGDKFEGSVNAMNIKISDGYLQVISQSKGLIYEANKRKALNLQSSMLNGFTGKILDENLGKGKAWISEESKVNAVTIFPIVGTFGSGKTRTIKEMLRANPNSKFVFISPRRALADDLRKALDIKKNWAKGKMNRIDIVTFEVALLSKRMDDCLVILDELQLFPPGYLDILIMKNQMNRLVILGDPAQAHYDSEKDRHMLGDQINDLVSVLEGNNYKYVYKSYRFTNPFFVGRLPCVFEDSRIKSRPENVYRIFDSIRDKEQREAIIKGEVILCPSFDEKKMISYIMGNSIKVLTYGESTGLTFKSGHVLLTQACVMVDQRRMLVALSRFEYELNFINLTGEDFREFVAAMPGTILHDFCAAKSSTERLKEFLPGKPEFISSRRVGSDEVDRESRLIGDPWLKTMIFNGQRPQAQEVEAGEVKSDEPKARIHLPIAPSNIARALNSEKIRDKAKREMTIKGLRTDQFRDEYFIKDIKRTSNQVDLFEAIYPRHKATDTATFLAAVRKRLSFSNPANEKAKFRSAKIFGEVMLKKFLERVPLKNGLDYSMLEEAKNEFEEKKLSKSVEMIANHSNRSNPDWDVREAFIFLKSQICTKFEKRFVDAKAGQTIACFSHAVLCRFAPWIRYIEKKVNQVLPQNYYIHSGKNFDQLQEWVVKNDFGGRCTESDYEAFDASQDATILAFEVCLMKYLRIPQCIIDDYVYIKVNCRCKLGIFSIMRFTGEASTFLFNTLANMCFTFMRYDLTGKEAIAFAGDDMCANRALRISREFEHVLDRLKLKAKVDIKTEASFCGWKLGSFGIFKRPQLVLERFEIAEERGTLADCIDNYAIEVSYAYRLGDKLSEFMDEEELDYQYLCIRKIIENQCKIKSNVLEFFRR